MLNITAWNYLAGVHKLCYVGRGIQLPDHIAATTYYGRVAVKMKRPARPGWHLGGEEP